VSFHLLSSEINSCKWPDAGNGLEITMNKKNTTIKKSINGICKKAKKNPRATAIFISGATISAIGNVVCASIGIKKVIDRKKAAKAQVTPPAQLPGPAPTNPVNPTIPAADPNAAVDNTATA
jgi:hypothetical protein